MKASLKFLVVLAAFSLVLLLGVPAGSPARAQSDPAVAELGQGFASATARVNGTTLHYVRGGSGPAVILIHGFPQDWYEFHHVMPRLAKKFTVIAVDLRGVGGSQATASGYDAANLAEDIHQLTEHLKLDKVYIVGHDMGGMVAYALARLYPQSLRGVMIIDVPLPGFKPWKEVVSDPMLWHVNFHQAPGIPEQLVAGRQDVYFRWFFTLGTVDHQAIGADDAAHYVKSYSAPGQLRAGFEFYRALPANEKFNASHTGPIALPLVMVGGDHSFGPLLPTLAEDLKSHGWPDVRVEIIKNAAHYIPDEQPEAVAALIERYGAAAP